MDDLLDSLVACHLGIEPADSLVQQLLSAGDWHRLYELVSAAIEAEDSVPRPAPSDEIRHNHLGLYSAVAAQNAGLLLESRRQLAQVEMSLHALRERNLRGTTDALVLEMLRIVSLLRGDHSAARVEGTLALEEYEAADEDLALLADEPHHMPMVLYRHLLLDRCGSLPSAQTYLEDPIRRLSMGGAALCE